MTYASKGEKNSVRSKQKNNLMSRVDDDVLLFLKITISEIINRQSICTFSFTSIYSIRSCAVLKIRVVFIGQTNFDVSIAEAKTL